MTLKLIQIDSSDEGVKNFQQIEVISEKFVLVSIKLDSIRPEKKYFGRCNWRYYGKAEPLTFYFDNSSDMLLCPSEITFFVDEIHSNQKICDDKPIAEEKGFPFFSVVDAKKMNDGFSYEEKGEISINLLNDHLSCLVGHDAIDTIVRVSDSVQFLFGSGYFCGIKLALNEANKLSLLESSLI